MINKYSTLTMALAAGAAASNRTIQQTIPIEEQPLYTAYNALRTALRERDPRIDFDTLHIGPGTLELLATLDQQVRESGALDDEAITAYQKDFLIVLADHAPEFSWAAGLNTLV